MAHTAALLTWTRMRRPAATRRIGMVVTGSLIAGFIAELTRTLGVFAGKEEPFVSGVVLLTFAGSWAAIALLSRRWTDQPLRWAAAPATCMTVLGVALIGLDSTAETLDQLGWVGPPVLLAGVAWMVSRCLQHPWRHQLQRTLLCEASTRKTRLSSPWRVCLAILTPTHA